ncbi:MAG: TIGR02147 family protein [Myxococcota bacterium]
MQTNAATALPTVYEYLDFRAYLGDWFSAKKAANPRFSHRAFARRAGQKSPSLLHHVIEGRRNLTPATTEAFAAALQLATAEADFFGLLVALGQAATDAERNAAWERIAATRRFREARRIEGDGFEYLSRWYYPAIRELAARPDFREDPEWIAQAVRPKITAARARRAVEVIVALGLWVRGDDGRLRRSDASVVTPHEVVGLAVHNYHHGMIERAREAIDAFDPEERHLGAVTVAVPEALVPELKRQVAAFQERILDLCDAAPDSDRVYQLNIQLFPLSEPRSPR